MPRGKRAERQHRFAAFPPPPPPPPCLRRRICSAKGASQTTFSFKDIRLHEGTSSWSAAYQSSSWLTVADVKPAIWLGYVVRVDYVSLDADGPSASNFYLHFPQRLRDKSSNTVATWQAHIA